jgi:hypothetical protein
MFAIRKTDLKTFTPDAYSVCRVPEGNTNTYLQEPRVIEEFLKGIEPKYNEAVARVTERSFDASCIYVLSGVIAYVLTCSPAGMRLNAEPLRSIVEESGIYLDANGKIPPPPRALGGASFTELLERGTLKIGVDPKFPQAIGIAKILNIANSFGNSSWDVLINDHEDSPFFSSDFPVAIESTPDPRIINRIVPLSPHILIRVRPNLATNTDTPDFTYQNFRRRVIKASRSEVMNLNRKIVRCAEELVFYRDDLSWISQFVHRNAAFRVQTRSLRIPHGKGTLLWSTFEVTDAHRKQDET